MIKAMKKINFISNLRNLYKIQLQKFMIPNQHKKALWLQIYIIKKNQKAQTIEFEPGPWDTFSRSDSALRCCNTIWIWRALSPHFVARLRRRGNGHVEQSFSNWCQQQRRSFWIPTPTSESPLLLSREDYYDVMVEQLRWRDGGHLRSERGEEEGTKGEKKQPRATGKGGKKIPTIDIKLLHKKNSSDT